MTLLEQATARGIEGFMHPAELETLAELARGKHVLEVGSFKGLSAWAMAQAAATVLCVDTFRANDAGQVQQEETTTLDAFLRAVAQCPNVDFVQGTSEAVAECMAEVSPERQFDLIFLDAMHTYEEVKADIERWWPRLRSGGILAVHDYGHDHFPGVKAAVDERFGDLGTYDPPNEDWIVTLRWVRKP